MFVFVYIYQPILSFVHLVVIPTLGTPKNIFCFNSNIMNGNSKQDRPERTSLVVPHSQNYAAGIRGHYHGSSDCFEYPKKPLLKSSHPKKYLPNFPTPKYPGMENFKTKKILRSSPSLEIRRTLPRATKLFFSKLFLAWCRVTVNIENYLPKLLLNHFKLLRFIPNELKLYYYYIYLFIYLLVLTGVNFLSFSLPPDSGERITLVVTSLLTMTVFMLLVAEIMPPVSDVVPIISIYYVTAMFVVSVSLNAF